MSELFQDWAAKYPDRIHFLWIALLVVGGLLALELRSRATLSAFMSPVMQRRLTAQASQERTLLKLGLLLMAMVAAVLAVRRPQSLGETETVTTSTPSADVMFVLDTSRSMLAEDTAPNRFMRAKAEIGQLVSRLEGQRVGLGSEEGTCNDTQCASRCSDRQKRCGYRQNPQGYCQIYQG